MEEPVNQDTSQRFRAAVKYILTDLGESPASEQATELADELIKMKAAFVQANNQEEAKRVWALEQGLKAREHYLLAFQQMKSEDYYDAWVNLERCEIILIFLERHFPITNTLLDFIAEQVKRFQDIYPYKLFNSPEFIIHETQCSICGRTTSLRNPCGHRVGEIYNGEICARSVTKPLRTRW